jgi:hypothetical protein
MTVLDDILICFGVIICKASVRFDQNIHSTSDLARDAPSLYSGLARAASSLYLVAYTRNREA